MESKELIPVKLRKRTGGLYLLSIPKEYTKDTFDKGLIMKVGERYIIKVVSSIENKPIPIIKKKLVEKSKSKGITIHIPMNRDFSEDIIDKEYPDISEMEREAKIDDLVEVFDFMILKYDDENGKMILEDNEELR